jgi:uncharacterized protein (DUF4415 family)
MKAKSTTRESRTDWDRLEGMKDSEIDFSDAPKLGKAFFQNSTVRLPQGKQSLSLRVDKGVLDWFKRQGKGYQTRINAVLRAYVQAHQR